jgi:aryl-alcohol dehydrogenase-like predicted oxidoreductase
VKLPASATHPPACKASIAENYFFSEAISITKRQRRKAGTTRAAWILSKGDDIIPIPGTKQTKYLEENAAATDVKLSQNEIAELEDAVPLSEVAGERYAPTSMQSINR